MPQYPYHLAYRLFSLGAGSTRSDLSVTIGSSPKSDSSMIVTARSDLVGSVGGAPIYSPCPRIALTFTPHQALTTPTAIQSTFSTVTAPCGTSTVLNIVSDLRASNSKNTATLPLIRYITG
jgi:hypothetical protein